MIELANAKVTKLAENRPHGRGPYLYLTGAQRYEVVKRAAQYGTTDTMWYFAKNYPNFLKLKETTVRRLKNLYKLNSLQAPPPKKSDSDGSDEDEDTQKKPMEVKELPCKKIGRPLLIGEELGTAIYEGLKKMWFSY